MGGIFVFCPGFLPVCSGSTVLKQKVHAGPSETSTANSMDDAPPPSDPETARAPPPSEKGVTGSPPGGGAASAPKPDSSASKSPTTAPSMQRSTAPSAAENGETIEPLDSLPSAAPQQHAGTMHVALACIFMLVSIQNTFGFSGDFIS